MWRTTAQADISGFVPGAGIVKVHVVSLRDQLFAGIVHQQTDYSCGAAAVATILDDAYGMHLSERAAILGMLRVSDYDTVKYRGFSMLDMKHYVESLGMEGVGYRLSIDTLYKVQVPSIVLMSIEGYEHFVVLKKATAEYAYVADPMLGNRAIPAADFASSWNNIIFVVAASGFDRDSALADIPLYVGSSHLAAAMPPNTNALANAVLMNVFIPAATRL
jgi:predicted double-glycine peptidase